MSPITIATTVACVAEILNVTGPRLVLGYSQGGRVALLVALAHPQLVSSLVVVSASPGATDPDQRRAADEELATRLERDGIETFLDSWLAAELTGTAHLEEDVQRRDRAMRSHNTAAGLAGALRGYGQGQMPPVAGRIGELVMPAVFLAGGRDERYSALAASMAAAAPTGRSVIVPDAGHNVILDAPEAVAAELRAALP